MAEVVTGLHAGMELQVLAFVENPSPPPARFGPIRTRDFELFAGLGGPLGGRKVRKERLPDCSLPSVVGREVFQEKKPDVIVSCSISPLPTNVFNWDLTNVHLFSLH